MKTTTHTAAPGRFGWQQGGLTSECPISQTFDRDGNGFIGASDLHNTYLAINEDLNDDEVKWNRFLMVEMQPVWGGVADVCPVGEIPCGYCAHCKWCETCLMPARRYARTQILPEP